MTRKSKSKTFPKGTEPYQIHDWVRSKIVLDPMQLTPWPVTDSKYLITITKIEDESIPTTSRESVH